MAKMFLLRLARLPESVICNPDAIALRAGNRDYRWYQQL